MKKQILLSLVCLMAAMVYADNIKLALPTPLIFN